MAQVGDSRAYRLRGDQFEQLTFDHSLVWEMRAAGQLPGDQVPEYIPKNVITRSLGPSPTVQVDMEGPFPLMVGDTFLLCSDGPFGPGERRRDGDDSSVSAAGRGRKDPDGSGQSSRRAGQHHRSYSYG